jgi:transcriptional regulator with XRE-family HTH domain
MTATESQRSPGSAPGAQLRAARTAKGITLRSLARMPDLSPATLSQVENGRTGLSVNRLNQIAEALGLTATQILSPAVEPESPSGRLSRAVAATVRRYPAAGGGELAPVRATRFRSRPAGRPRRVRSGRVPRRNRARHRRQVRLSVSGIYHYYTSKQQMLARTLDLTTADLMHRAQAARRWPRSRRAVQPAHREPRAVPHAQAGTRIRRASEMRSLDAGNRQKIASMRTAQRRMIDHEVDQAVRFGRFRADHPHEAAGAVTTCTAAHMVAPAGPARPRASRQAVCRLRPRPDAQPRRRGHPRAVGSRFAPCASRALSPAPGTPRRSACTVA